MSDKRFYGYIKDKKDDRDHVYHAPIGAAELPKKVNLIPKLSECYDQLRTNSCVANSISAAAYFLDNTIGKPSRLFNYYEGRRLSNSQNQDQGMEIRDGIKALAKVGIPPEIDWPFSEARVNTKPSPDKVYEVAAAHQAIKYERVNQTLTDIKSVLASGYPIVFGFVVYSSFEKNNSGKMKLPTWYDREQGRHCVLLVGYDDDTSEFIVRNSWGTNWGLKGNFTMPYKFGLNSKYSTDFWTIKEIEK